MKYQEMLKQELDRRQIAYHVINEEAIELYDKRDKTGAIRVVVIFKADNEARPSLKCYEIGKFPKEKTAAAMVACNNANKHYRWVKFSIDNEDDLVVSADTIVSEGNMVDRVMELVARMINIVNETFESFMLAKWA